MNMILLEYNHINEYLDIVVQSVYWIWKMQVDKTKEGNEQKGSCIELSCIGTIR